MLRHLLPDPWALAPSAMPGGRDVQSAQWKTTSLQRRQASGTLRSFIAHAQGAFSPPMSQEQKSWSTTKLELRNGARPVRLTSLTTFVTNAMCPGLPDLLVGATLSFIVFILSSLFKIPPTWDPTSNVSDWSTLLHPRIFIFFSEGVGHATPLLSWQMLLVTSCISSSDHAYAWKVEF